MDEDCRLFGVDPASLTRAAPESHDGIWRDHVTALRAYLAIADQWRVVAGGSGALWLGLDYGAARAGLDLAGIAVSPEVWADVQLIEAGAKAALNEAK